MNKGSYLSIDLKPDEVATIIQVTDTHLFEESDKALLGLKTGTTFDSVIDLIKSNLAKQPEPLNMLIASGDLTQDRSDGSYLRFIEKIKPFKVPCFWITGNHDDHAKMNRLLTQAGYPEYRTALIGERWAIIGLNSQTSEPSGYLSEAELSVLEEQLQNCQNRSVMILIHHHVLLTESKWLDQHNLKNSDAFFELIHRYSNVKIVSCGHIHQERDETIQGIRFLSTPSTCFQFYPKSEGFKLDTTMPGYRTYQLKPDGSFETQCHRTPFNQQFLSKENCQGYD